MPVEADSGHARREIEAPTGAGAMGDRRRVRRPSLLALAEALRLRPVARRLDLDVDPEALRFDVAGLGESLWSRHPSPDHDGGWEYLSLWAPGGDCFEARHFGAPYGATVAFERSPHLRRFLTSISVRRSRVRLLRLRAGGRIHPHRDRVEHIASGLIRLHVPIVAPPEVRFEIGGTRVPMRPGEAWHVDIRFRHQVSNPSPFDRVHLVADLIPEAPADAATLFRGARVLARRWLLPHLVEDWMAARRRADVQRHEEAP